MSGTRTRWATIEWDGEVLRLIDQRKLPASTEYVVCETAEEVANAIRQMVVRGAPAIGATAAYGIALGARRLAREGSDVSTSASGRSEEHTSELQSRENLVCRLL